MQQVELLELPVEIRLAIYSYLFGSSITCLNGGRQDVGSKTIVPSLFPDTISSISRSNRSAQLLCTCKTILAEARPVLYEKTVFRTSVQAFAGRLPTHVSDQSLIFPHVKRLEWQLSCDLLKVYKAEDVAISKEDIRGLETIQVTCQAENWRGSFCGEWCDREIFIKGRRQVLDFVKLLQSRMVENGRRTTLLEDTRGLSRGRVVLKLMIGRREAGPGELYVS